MGEEKKQTAREIIESYNGPKVRIMEVCGTHTHEIFRLGIRKLLPPQVELMLYIKLINNKVINIFTKFSSRGFCGFSSIHNSF